MTNVLNISSARHCKGSLLRIEVDEQADIGADHSRGNHSMQDISIWRPSSVVQNITLGLPPFKLFTLYHAWLYTTHYVIHFIMSLCPPFLPVVALWSRVLSLSFAKLMKIFGLKRLVIVISSAVICSNICLFISSACSSGVRFSL